jgi:hypothetical protein
MSDTVIDMTKPWTNNLDIIWLYGFFQHYIIQTQRCESANTNTVSEDDLVRLEAIIREAKANSAHVKAQPYLDLPKTTPMRVDLPPPVEQPPMQNNYLNGFRALMTAARDELWLCPSTSRGSKLEEPDQLRLDRVITKAEAYLKNVRANGLVRDLPEVHMTVAQIGHGEIPNSGPR